jgi:hypothetical protein
VCYRDTELPIITITTKLIINIFAFNYSDFVRYCYFRASLGLSLLSAALTDELTNQHESEMRNAYVTKLWEKHIRRMALTRNKMKIPKFKVTSRLNKTENSLIGRRQVYMELQV